MNRPSDEGRCDLCGEPMPDGESMFRMHGYSGPCPKPPLPVTTPTHCACVWHGQADGPPFSECHYHAALRAELAALKDERKDWARTFMLDGRTPWEWENLCKRAEAELAAARARVAECESTNSARVDNAERERDGYRNAMYRMTEPVIALAALQPPPIIMPARDFELQQQIQTLNERIAYLEPIFVAAKELVDNAEEYECDGLGLFAQHGWWEPLHDALDPDGSEAADDIRQPVTPAK